MDATLRLVAGKIQGRADEIPATSAGTSMTELIMETVPR